MWECNSSLKCECLGISAYPQKTEYHSQRNSLFEGTTKATIVDRAKKGLKARFTDVYQGRACKEEIFNVWYQIVHAYASLELTKSSDQTHALAGILSRISEQVEGRHVAGIWTADSPRGQLWSVPRGDLQIRPNIPSWSWMSPHNIKNSALGVWYRDLQEFTPDDRLEVHFPGTLCDKIDGDALSELQYSQLQLTVSVQQGRLIQSEKCGEKSWTVHFESSGKKFIFHDCPTSDQLIEEDVLYTLTDTSARSGYRIVEQILVLKPHNGGRTYTRVGLFHYPCMPYGVFERAEIRKLLFCKTL